MKKLQYFLSALLVCFVASSLMASKDDEEKRLAECTRVVKEVLDIPEGIPQDLVDKAECVAVMPSVKKAAFGIGGSYGKGALICRTGKDYKGPWGVPAMYRLEGASFGFQIGGSATDFLLLVVNPSGVESLLKSKVKLGADASAAAGPKGRSTQAATDVLMTAEILTYSRSKGLFAGVSLEGSTLREDSGANKDLYDGKISAKEIILEGKATASPNGKELTDLLQARSPENKSN